MRRETMAKRMGWGALNIFDFPTARFMAFCTWDSCRWYRLNSPFSGTRVNALRILSDDNTFSTTFSPLRLASSWDPRITCSPNRVHRISYPQQCSSLLHVRAFSDKTAYYAFCWLLSGHNLSYPKLHYVRHILAVFFAHTCRQRSGVPRLVLPVSWLVNLAYGRQHRMPKRSPQISMWAFSAQPDHLPCLLNHGASLCCANSPGG